jgi:hypothetical protein
MVDSIQNSLLTFSKGLELRRQTGLEVRVLVLSKLLAGENILGHSRRAISANV